MCACVSSYIHPHIYAHVNKQKVCIHTLKYTQAVQFSELLLINIALPDTKWKPVYLLGSACAVILCSFIFRRNKLRARLLNLYTVCVFDLRSMCVSHTLNMHGMQAERQMTFELASAQCIHSIIIFPSFTQYVYFMYVVRKRNASVFPYPWFLHITIVV